MAKRKKSQYKTYKEVFKRYDEKCQNYTLRLRVDSVEDLKVIEYLEANKVMGISPKESILRLILKK